MLCYELNEVPDLSLRKYSSLDNSGVAGVLERHSSFLRQFNRIGLLLDCSIHLAIKYYGSSGSEESAEGSRLKMFVFFDGPNDIHKQISAFMQSSPLASFYELKADNQGDAIWAQLQSKRYAYCSALYKTEFDKSSERQTRGSADEYYSVASLEMNEEGRLYNMLIMMDALDLDCIYRIDLYPVSKYAHVEKAFERPISILREKQRSNGSYGRDYEAESILKKYEDLLDNLESSPQFIFNAFVFGDGEKETSMLLDAAGSEAVKTGLYEISVFRRQKGFDIMSFISEPNMPDLTDVTASALLTTNSHGAYIGKKKYEKYRLRLLPSLFTLEEVTPFFQLPALYDGESIQMRKETTPNDVSECDGLFLGRDDNGYPVFFPLKNIQKHAFIAGVPGAGKTNTMLQWASEMWLKHDIPFLVFEPAKQEYRALMNHEHEKMKRVHFYSPNAEMLFPLHINPFQFPKGLTVSEHIRRLMDVFTGAFPLDNPMPFLLDTAIEAVYRDLGWSPKDVHTDKNKKKFPTMSMLYSRLEEELKQTTYSDEVRGNLESALRVRIGSLLRREMGEVFDVADSTLTPEAWLNEPAIIELEAMGNGPGNFLMLMLCTLVRETLKVNPIYDKNHARHVIFIEEAHNLLGPDTQERAAAEADAKQAATIFTVKMLAEVRALKEGIFIADQIPSSMASEVIKNTGLKLAFRITSADDRELLCSTMSANAMQAEEVGIFSTGKALVSYEGLLRPFKVSMQEWRGYGAEYCIADKEERKLSVTPKLDAELSAAIRSNIAYENDLRRSAEIKMRYYAKMRADLMKSFEIQSELLKDGKKFYRILEEQRRKVEAEAANIVARRQNGTLTDSDVERMDSLMIDLNNSERIFSDDYAKNPLVLKAADLRGELCLLILEFEHDIRFWTRMGITSVLENAGKIKEVLLILLDNLTDSLAIFIDDPELSRSQMRNAQNALAKQRENNARIKQYQND